ncbi:LIM/homeobox protein Lhx2-like [Huso huso]|uniref:LIM/homeobox protein Lhx9 n=1 Tax=Huso huso TaxID=61971 RepID=A0ABR0YB11_HUSHU
MAEGGSFTAMLLQGFGGDPLSETSTHQSRGAFKQIQGHREVLGERCVVCAGCGGRVYDRYFLLAVDRQWHAGCLRCSLCQCALDAQLTCFSKDGAIYCKEDYYSRFCVQCCARCGLGVPASSLVMRARDSVFHLRCFTCLPCGAVLQPGDLFTMRGGDLYCQRHSTHGHTPKPRLRKRRATPTERERNTAGLLPLEEGEGFLGGPEPQLAGQQQEGMSVSKTKRIRTCFKNHQLRTMESYFAVKHNPDGKDWEQLAKRTGLPKRVLQVWFQNARAKLRKTLTTDEPIEGEGADDTATTTIDQSQLSLTATPPMDLPTPASEPSAQPIRAPSPFLSFPEFSGSYITQPGPIMAPIFLNFDLGESTTSSVEDSGPASFF